MYYQRTSRSATKLPNNFSRNRIILEPVEKIYDGKMTTVEDDIILDKVPNYFRNIKNRDLEPQIPLWNIQKLELDKLYHSVRLKEYFEDKYPVYTSESLSCKMKSIKRLIPWLYPEAGKFN